MIRDSNGREITWGEFAQQLIDSQRPWYKRLRLPWRRR